MKKTYITPYQFSNLNTVQTHGFNRIDFEEKYDNLSQREQLHLELVTHELNEKIEDIVQKEIKEAILDYQPDYEDCPECDDKDQEINSLENDVSHLHDSMDEAKNILKNLKCDMFLSIAEIRQHIEGEDKDASLKSLEKIKSLIDKITIAYETLY